MKRDCPGEKQANVVPYLTPRVCFTAHAEPGPVKLPHRNFPGDRFLHPNRQRQLHIPGTLHEYLHFCDDVNTYVLVCFS